MRDIGVEPLGIFLEPVGRNTAPAAAVAALTLLKRDPDAVMLLLPADHLIRDIAAFHAAIRSGLDAVAAGYLVTFGIVPDTPETGYGYPRVPPLGLVRRHRCRRALPGQAHHGEAG